MPIETQASKNHIPKCICCNIVVEYNSKGHYWQLCQSCFEATDRFIKLRRENFKKRGLIKR